MAAFAYLVDKVSMSFKLTAKYGTRVNFFASNVTLQFIPTMKCT